MTLEKLDLHLFISGQVQGVSYRANAARMGSTHGLSGWVRNLPDGRVELLAQGEEKNLRNFLAWVHQGPAQARVDHVETHWAPADVELSDFQVRD
jgi:acylphosphatase